MYNRKEFLKSLLAKNELTISEKDWLTHYLNDDNNRLILEELLKNEYDSDLTNVKKMLDKKLSGKLLQDIHGRIGIKAPKKATIFTLYKLTAAAAVLILIAGALLMKQSVINFFYPVQMQQVATKANERKKVLLADGSVVSMEENSLLKFPDKFTENTREVSLKGEAFFEVAKDRQHPFIIHSRLLKTTVVGTSFNVADNDSINARVVVVTGIVRVQPGKGKADNEVKLVPQEAVSFNVENQLLQKSILPGEANFYRQRASGTFTYSGAPITNIIKDIEHFYKTTITIDDKMKSCLFYGGFDTKDNIATVLKIVAISMNATVHQNERNHGYILTGGGCN